MIRIAVVYEAPADLEIATVLADRVLCEGSDWMEDYLAHKRTWLSTSAKGRSLTWKGIKRLALEAGVTAEGHFGRERESGSPDARAARRAILYLLREYPDLDAVVLIRDQDDQPGRRHGLEQARSEEHGELRIVVGLAIVERECWVISGFDPRSPEEESRLQSERATLGFDPRDKSHELTACKDDTAKRSPKRVLRALSDGDPERERRCWRDTPLSVLRDRGEHNGLADYLAEVHGRLAPLIG